MTGEVRAGVAVLAAVVAGSVGGQALRPEPRHDGLTRARVERFASFGIPRRCIRHLRCSPRAGHWYCAVALSDGQTIGYGSGPTAAHGTPGAFVFFC